MLRSVLKSGCAVIAVATISGCAYYPPAAYHYRAPAPHTTYVVPNHYNHYVRPAPAPDYIWQTQPRIMNETHRTYSYDPHPEPYIQHSH